MAALNCKSRDNELHSVSGSVFGAEFYSDNDHEPDLVSARARCGGRTNTAGNTTSIGCMRPTLIEGLNIDPKYTKNTRSNNMR